MASDFPFHDKIEVTLPLLMENEFTRLKLETMRETHDCFESLF